mgnify:FL=1
MTRRLIAVFSVLIIVFSAGCQLKEEGVENERDIAMNIIDSNSNIKSIALQAEEFTLQDVVDKPFGKALVIGQLGEVRAFKEGYFNAKGDSIGYVDKDGDEIKDVAGVIIDPPEGSITDSYYDIKKYIENENVMFLLLDGFGYHQYEYARENGFLPFLKNYEARKALSVYKPVTNAGLAAIITGTTPEENGIYSRKQRELKVDSIFKQALELNKSTAYIEGNIGIVNTEVQPVLNLDENKDGYTDDEVYKSIIKAIEDGNEFIFAHFHGIDDAAHSYGPLSDEAMERIKTIDSYIEGIVPIWDGVVIISADHGVHSAEDGGDHGEFRYEDLIVPYIIINRGSNVE